MKKIPLTQCKVALVDNDSYIQLKDKGWIYHSQGYAYTWDRTGEKPKCILMHRLINKTPKGLDTDHINGNRLDNRKKNLRSASRSANSLNRKTLGIESSKIWSGYVVRLFADGQRIYIGRFKDKEDAMNVSMVVKQQLLEAIL